MGQTICIIYITVLMRSFLQKGKWEVSRRELESLGCQSRGGRVRGDGGSYCSNEGDDDGGLVAVVLLEESMEQKYVLRDGNKFADLLYCPLQSTKT